MWGDKSTSSTLTAWKTCKKVTVQKIFSNLRKGYLHMIERWHFKLQNHDTVNLIINLDTRSRGWFKKQFTDLYFDICIILKLTNTSSLYHTQCTVSTILVYMKEDRRSYRFNFCSCKLPSLNSWRIKECTWWLFTTIIINIIR